MVITPGNGRMLESPQIVMRMVKFSLILLALTATAAAQQEFQLKVDVALVSVDVGVYDRKGESVTTLQRDDFQIFEDGVPQQIRAFEPSGVSFNALLVVDRSRSMERAWDSVVTGLNRFMEVLRPQDRVAIAAFDSGIDMMSDWRSAKGGRQTRIGMMADGSGTDFYGAVSWAATYIRGEKGRKGVILFSDGKQSGGGGFYGRGSRPQSTMETDLRKTTETLRRANIPYYFVGYDTDPESAAAMKQLAEASGGRAYFPEFAGDLVGVYEQIARDLGRAYSLSYATTRPPDGKFRKIEVKPIDVRLRIAQSRDGYYARPSRTGEGPQRISRAKTSSFSKTGFPSRFATSTPSGCRTASSSWWTGAAAKKKANGRNSSSLRSICS
jgi:Ca-activated chloride channel family protein